MESSKVSLILAAGGQEWLELLILTVNLRLSVGAGNTPAVIDETAYLKMPVSSILISETFENGIICASKQSVTLVTKFLIKKKRI